MTDQELQLELTKMLPGQICYQEFTHDGKPVRLFQWGEDFDINAETMLRTEWMHVCWLVEQSLSVNEWNPYLDSLEKICSPTRICPASHAMSVCCASWQQRAEALCKVKSSTQKTQ